MHFEFLFCMWYEVVLQLYSFEYRYIVVPSPFTEKTILYPLNNLVIKINCPKMWKFISGLTVLLHWPVCASFFSTVFLRYNWHIKSCTYLIYTVWCLDICIQPWKHHCDKISVINISITSKNFFLLCFYFCFLFFCIW